MNVLSYQVLTASASQDYRPHKERLEIIQTNFDSPYIKTTIYTLGLWLSAAAAAADHNNNISRHFLCCRRAAYFHIS